MTDPKYWSVVDKLRLLMDVENYRVCCLNCRGHLTAAEMAQERAYCEVCWPEELQEREE